MPKLRLLLALAAGGILAWVDARPGFDDTGIMAGLVLLTAALFGALAPRQPWRWALAVGLWIPVAAIVRDGNSGAVLALVIAFVGAYGGAMIGRALAPDRP